MSSLNTRARLVSGLAGAALVAQLAVLRAASSANDAFVTLFGRELHWGCSFKQAFGIPCPNCGLTRGVVFTLHGELERAFGMNPAGPLLVFGALLLGAALLFVALAPRAGGAPARDTLVRKLFVGASAYGGLTAVVLLAHWVRVIS